MVCQLITYVYIQSVFKCFSTWQDRVLLLMMPHTRQSLMRLSWSSEIHKSKLCCVNAFTYSSNGLTLFWLLNMFLSVVWCFCITCSSIFVSVWNSNVQLMSDKINVPSNEWTLFYWVIVQRVTYDSSYSFTASSFTLWSVLGRPCIVSIFLLSPRIVSPSENQTVLPSSYPSVQL